MSGLIKATTHKESNVSNEIEISLPVRLVLMLQEVKHERCSVFLSITAVAIELLISLKIGMHVTNNGFNKIF